MSNTSPHTESNLAEVVEIRKPKRSEARFQHTIYQEDLEHLILLSHELDRAREEYLNKRDYIKAALQAGATIEPGIHGAELVTVSGGGKMVAKWTATRLMVR